MVTGTHQLLRWFMAGRDTPNPATLPAARQVDETLVTAVRLAVISGQDRGAVADLAGERLVIGTQEGAGLRLRDETVSRFHCEIARQDGRLLLRDLGSLNGTLVDGVPVLVAYVRPGSLVTVGATVVRVELGPAPVALRHSPRTRFGGLVGHSIAMRRVFDQLERAAQSDATVLLLGETGTGKEATAEAIHEAGRRREGPFVTVDCGAIPAELLESELFGHERGSFTGALRAREGSFRAAAGGTVFLDEIGELPLDLQPKLLRVLERRTVKPVGAEGHIPVDLRVIAATHQDLRAQVNAGRFRGDLYYRLAVVEIHLPSLRERPEDVPLLIEHLLDDMPGAAADKARLLAPSWVAGLARHAWPGNVRELRNVLERALALGAAAATPVPAAAAVSEPTSAAPAPAVDLSQPFRPARDAWSAIFEKAYLTALLDAHGGNIRAAARAAMIDRVYLYRLLDKHGLR